MNRVEEPLVVSPTAKRTAKIVSNSTEVTAKMAVWKRIAILRRSKFLLKMQRKRVIIAT